MGDPLALERYYWFDHQVRCGRYPNAGRLAERFELSRRTAARVIEFLRYRASEPTWKRSSRRNSGTR